MMTTKQLILFTLSAILGLLALLAVPSCVEASLVNFSSVNLQTGTDTITNANGTGLDLGLSFTGGFTSGGGSVTNAAWGLGGDPTRFGWETNVTAGALHTTDTVFRIDALNGTFDASFGWERPIGSPLDDLFIRSDGMFNIGANWTLTGDTVQSGAGSFGFTSGTSTSGIFVVEVIGATNVEFFQDNRVQFAGSGAQTFDFDLRDQTVTAIPETTFPRLLAFVFLAFLLLRRSERSRHA